MDGLRQLLQQLGAGLQVGRDMVDAARHTSPVLLAMVGCALLGLFAVLLLLARTGRRPPLTVDQLPPLPRAPQPHRTHSSSTQIHIDQAVIFTDPDALRGFTHGRNTR